MEKTVKPIQKRSQETKQKLMQAAFAMYVKKGYHSTTVDDIAAEAELSTGIAYRYFKNKKDILLSSLSYAFENIKELADIEGADENTPMAEYLELVLCRFEALHEKYRDIHEELEGLRHTDDDVRALYQRIESAELGRLAESLSKKLHQCDDLHERVYLAVGVMEQYCHLKINGADRLDLEKLRKITANTAAALFE